MESILKKHFNYQRKKLLRRRQGAFFKKTEVLHYLNLLMTDTSVSNFLKYDGCFRLADNYLLAMVFVFFKRVGLTNDDFTYINFFAALLLAHSLVEEDDALISEIHQFALLDLSMEEEFLAQLHSLKFLMFQAIGMKGYVPRSSLLKVMTIAPHPLWDRQRDALHAGAAHLPTIQLAPVYLSEQEYDWRTNSCSSCREARKKLLQQNHN